MRTIRKPHVIASFALIFLALSSCEPIAFGRALALGPGLPPRPANCPIEVSRVSPEDAKTRWRQIGVVCLATAGFFDPGEAYAPGGLHDALQTNACWLGGDLVTPVGFCPVESATGLAGYPGAAIEFAVFRTSDPDKQATAATTATPAPPPPRLEVVCAEANDYERRAAAAEGAARAALQRIANTKAQQCADAKSAAQQGTTGLPAAPTPTGTGQ
jgi:hypothetical protein